MRRALTAGFAIALIAGALGAAHAATLQVDTASLYATSVSGRCSSETIAVTAGPTSAGQASSVALTVPDGCRGADGVLRLTTAGGPTTPADIPFTFPTTGTTATVAVPAFAPKNVTDTAVALRTWGMHSQWVYAYTPAPVKPVTCAILNRPSVPCTATVTSFTMTSSTPGGAVDRFQITVRLETSSTAQNAVWRATFDFADGQYPFIPKTVSSDGRTVLAPGSTCQPLTVGGNPNAAGGTKQVPWDQIRSGAPREVVLTGQLTATPAGNLVTCP